MYRNKVAAIGTLGEQIKTNSTEYLWICRCIKPPLVLDKPVAADTGVNPEDLHLRRLNSAAPPTQRL